MINQMDDLPIFMILSNWTFTILHLLVIAFVILSIFLSWFDFSVSQSHMSPRSLSNYQLGIEQYQKCLILAEIQWQSFVLCHESVNPAFQLVCRNVARLSQLQSQNRVSYVVFNVDKFCQMLYWWTKNLLHSINI